MFSKKVLPYIKQKRTIEFLKVFNSLSLFTCSIKNFLRRTFFSLSKSLNEKNYQHTSKKEKKRSALKSIHAMCKQSFKVSIIRNQSIIRMHVVDFALNHEVNVNKTSIFKRVSYIHFIIYMRCYLRARDYNI